MRAVSANISAWMERARSQLGCRLMVASMANISLPAPAALCNWRQTTDFLKEGGNIAFAF